MIAVYLQELPHRIGDYAVFVNAGMTPFQVSSDTSDMDYPESGLPLFTIFLKATIFNIISTSTAYLGCLMGLLLLDSGAIKEEYIFGIGTFWYIFKHFGHRMIFNPLFRHGCISLRCCWCFDS